MDNEEQQGLIALLLVCSLSFLSTLSVIIWYFCKCRFHSFSHELVIMLCFSDMLYSLVGLTRSLWMLIDNDAYISGTACYIQAIYIQTFDISSCICTTSISYSLYLQVAKRISLTRFSAFKLYWKRNYLIPFIASLVFAVFSLVGHNQPYENTYCTVCSTDLIVTQILQMIYFYIPQISSLLFNIVMIALVIKAYSNNWQMHNLISFKEMLSLTAYPLILLFCQIPLIVIRIMEYQGAYYEKATIIMYILSQSVGFFNAVVYAVLSLKIFSSSPDKNQIRSTFKTTCTSRTLTNPLNNNNLDESIDKNDSSDEQDNYDNSLYTETENTSNIKITWVSQ